MISSIKSQSYAKYLEKSQIAEIQKAFNIFDQDRSGEISIRELDQILKSLGHTLPEEELEHIVQKVDKDGNGFIDFEQFLDLVSQTMISNRSQKFYIDTFRLIDEKNDGILDKQQLIRANKIAGNPLTEHEIDEIFNYVVVKYEGRLNINTVLKMLLRKSVI